MNETKREPDSYKLRFTEGTAFTCDVERPGDALREAAEYLDRNPQLTVTGFGYAYSFEDNVFFLHMFAE